MNSSYVDLTLKIMIFSYNFKILMVYFQLIYSIHYGSLRNSNQVNIHNSIHLLKTNLLSIFKNLLTSILK